MWTWFCTCQVPSFRIISVIMIKCNSTTDIFFVICFKHYKGFLTWVLKTTIKSIITISYILQMMNSYRSLVTFPRIHSSKKQNWEYKPRQFENRTYFGWRHQDDKRVQILSYELKKFTENNVLIRGGDWRW